MSDESVPSPEAQLESFFSKYESSIARLGKAVRAKVRARLPGLHEIVYVYENQGSLVLSYSPTEHGFQGLCGIAVHADCVKLFFGQGAALAKSDPKQLLEGGGKMVRHVVLRSVADFERAEIEALFAAALKLAKLRLDPAAKGSILVKAEAQKRRAQRAKKATRAKPARAKPTRANPTRAKPTRRASGAKR